MTDLDLLTAAHQAHNAMREAENALVRASKAAIDAKVAAERINDRIAARIWRDRAFILTRQAEAVDAERRRYS